MALTSVLSSSGTSYVLFGKASGFGATLELSTLTNMDGFRILRGGDVGEHLASL